VGNPDEIRENQRITVSSFLEPVDINGILQTHGLSHHIMLVPSARFLILYEKRIVVGLELPCLANRGKRYRAGPDNPSKGSHARWKLNQA